MPTDNTTAATTSATLSDGQRLYEAWNHGIGLRHFTRWSELDSRARSKNPAAIGQANEPWARAVLAEAAPS